MFVLFALLIALAVVGATVAAARLARVPVFAWGRPAWTGPDPFELEAALRGRLGLDASPLAVAEEIAATRAFAAANTLEVEPLEAHLDRLAGSWLGTMQAHLVEDTAGGRTDLAFWADRFEPLLRANIEPGADHALAVSTRRGKIAVVLVAARGAGRLLNERPGQAPGVHSTFEVAADLHPRARLDPPGLPVVARAADTDGQWFLDVPHPEGAGPFTLRFFVGDDEVGRRSIV